MTSDPPCMCCPQVANKTKRPKSSQGDTLVFQMLPSMHSPAGTFLSFNPPYKRKMEPHLLDLRLPQELEDSYLEKAEFS